MSAPSLGDRIEDWLFADYRFFLSLSRLVLCIALIVGSGFLLISAAELVVAVLGRWALVTLGAVLFGFWLRWTLTGGKPRTNENDSTLY